MSDSKAKPVVSYETIIVSSEEEVRFNNNVDFCVGTGRFGLGLTKEYLDELKMCQEEIGFKHIRGHGLFTDDTAIYHEYEEDGVTKVEYNYTYVDRVVDEYIKLGIRPFIELGFMPKKLASGEQAIFYWKGYTTPPKSYERWCDMVVALLKHFVERYGEEDVITWPIEVWNEPNLPGFWYKADMQEYFKLFKYSFDAIKAYNPRFRVGGPAICGVRDEEWITEFMKFCRDNKIKLDFVTRHHYTVELPERVGHYDYHKLMKAEEGFENLQKTRDIIDSFEEYKGLEIHITEFSSSYTPFGVIHDTNLNAALMSRQLSRLGDMNESYSYWTFGDVFEEQGVPFTPFHGGFGLVAGRCIPKPTFWTFAFFSKLKKLTKKCIYRDDNAVIVKTEDGYAGIAFNDSSEVFVHNRYILDSISKEYSVVYKTVDPHTTNPLKVWHDMGEPSSLSDEQVSILKDAAKPFITSTRIEEVENRIELPVSVEPEGVVFFEVKAGKVTPDRGYDYNRVITTR